MAKLKIVSDGTPYGTRIFDEFGNEIENVTRIEWKIAATGMARATIDLQMVPVEVSGELQADVFAEEELHADMSVDTFADTTYGQAALAKLGAVPDNFRLYFARFHGRDPLDRSIIEVRGAVFRVAKAGPNKGKLSIMVKGTMRQVFVLRSEIEASHG